MSDLIDRQALLKQIDIDSDGEPGYYGDTWKFIDTIKNMPNVHDLPKDTDMISRQAAIDELVKMLSDCFYADEEVLDAVKTTLKELPPAQPETTTVTIGRTRGGTTMWYECDNCGEPVDQRDNYCPNCGRKLRKNE